MKECNCSQELKYLRKKAKEGDVDSVMSYLHFPFYTDTEIECSSNDPEEETLSTDEIIDKTLSEIVGGLTLASNSFNPIDKHFKYNFTLGSEVEFDMDINGKRVKFTVNVDKRLK